MESLTPIAEWLNNCSTDNWLENADFPGIPFESDDYTGSRSNLIDENIFETNHQASSWLLAPSPTGDQLAQSQSLDWRVNAGIDWRSEVDALRLEVASLRESLQRTLSHMEECQRKAARLDTLEGQVMALFKWSAEVSTTIMDFQLKQEGLSPLQKHFGFVLGPKFKKQHVSADCNAFG